MNKLHFGIFTKTIKTAVEQTYSLEHSLLALSLQCYTSVEDTGLGREQFLRNVVARIELDLETGKY